MGRSNESLLKAKREKQDEFYTLYEDVENEMQHYDFNGKTIYCPCDDFRWSNFVKYFRRNFNELGLKRLIATNYDIGEGAFVYMCDANGEYAFRVDGKGDYRDYNALRDEADIIVTNPPFSKWRDFFKWARVKDCLVVGPITALHYNEVYPLLLTTNLKLGYKGHRERIGFYHIDTDGNSVFKPAIWFTTLEVEHKDKFIPTEAYSPEKYPYYDGTDIIEVKPYNKLPKDYYGKMGVCDTFFFYYPYLDYEVLERRGDLKLNGKAVYERLIIRRIKK